MPAQVQAALHATMILTCQAIASALSTSSHAPEAVHCSPLVLQMQQIR